MQGKAASYERVSTRTQGQHGFSLGAQRRSPGEFAADNGWSLSPHLRFRDGEEVDASGAGWDLPGLNNMLEAAGMASLPNSQALQQSPRAMIYVRVSTSSQEEDGTSLATQEERCRQFATERGYRIADVVSDTWTAAEYRQRPGLSELRERVRAGLVDVVLAYALDRLSRNQAHLYIIAEEFEAHGARLEFVTESFENSAVGRFIRSAKAFAAEIEHEKTAERTTRGKRARVARGKPLFGPKPPYGLRWNEAEHRYGVYEPEARIIRRIVNRYLAGASLRKITSELAADGIPGPTGGSWWSETVRLILGDERYAGKALAYRNKTERQNGRWLRTEVPDGWTAELPEGTFPQIMTDEEYAAIQARFTRNRAEAFRHNLEPECYLLRAGYIRCGLCGGNMVAFHDRQRGLLRYGCGNGRRGGNVSCRPISIDAPTIDEAVWSRVEAVLTRPDIIEQQLGTLLEHDPTEAELRALNRAADEIRRQQTNLTSSLALFDGDTDAAAPIIERLRQLAAQERGIASERAEMEARRETWQEARGRMDGIVSWCRRVASNLSVLDYEQKRLALAALGVCVLVYPADHMPRYVIEMAIPLEESCTFSTSTSWCAGHNRNVVMRWTDGDPVGIIGRC